MLTAANDPLSLSEKILMNPIPMTTYDNTPSSIFRNYQRYMLIECGLVSVPAVMRSVFARTAGDEDEFLCPSAAF